MSRIVEVIRNKNRVERNKKIRQRQEMESMKSEALFRARIHDEFNRIGVLLDSDEIDSVIIEVGGKNIGKFGGAIYSTDLTEFDIEQVHNEPNKFIIRKKFITF